MEYDFFDNDVYIPLDAYGEEEGEVESLDVVGEDYE